MHGPATGVPTESVAPASLELKCGKIKWNQCYSYDGPTQWLCVQPACFERGIDFCFGLPAHLDSA